MSLPESTPSAETQDGLRAEHVRADFPILGRDVHGNPLVYLDNAATTQKPRAVIKAVRNFYERYNSNVDRKSVV